MPIPSLLGDDPRIAVLVTDPRAALEAARRLRGSERRLDGPFVLWDGKAGVIRITILVTQPGGASAWFAAAKLAARRFRPTLMLGITPVLWCGDILRPQGMVASAVLDLAPIEGDLAQAEATATQRLPERVAVRVEGRSLPRYESRMAAAFARELKDAEAAATPERSGVPGEKSVESDTGSRVTFTRRRLDIGELACWGRGALESLGAARWLAEKYGVLAIDQESAGLAEAAGECTVPWVVMGPCLSLPDPASVGGQQSGRAEALGRQTEAPVTESLVSFMDALRSPHPEFH